MSVEPRNAVVDVVRHLGWQAEDVRYADVSSRFVRVELGEGVVGLLDVTLSHSATWAEVLESLRREGRPAYVEIDPDTELITQLLLPKPFRVGEIMRVDGGMQVELIISHARHLLSTRNPKYKELLDTLERARLAGGGVLVTETLDEHEIVDVRPLPGPVATSDRRA